jgi:lysozyme
MTGWTPIQRLADRVRRLTADRRKLTQAQAAVARDEQLIADLHPTRTSDEGLRLIADFEGVRLTAYRDPVGVLTIGWGHTGSDVTPGLTITRERALELLRQDVHKAEEVVVAAVKVPLTRGQFDALVSLTFNIGAAAFRGSTLLRELNAGRYDRAAGEFDRWTRAGGRVLAGLVRRRAAERALFEKDS